MYIYILTGGVLTTIAFSLYVTFHPGMKGITFRPDDTGTVRFTPLNLLRIMAAPFHDPDFWKINFLDTNYLVWLAGGLCSGGLVYFISSTPLVTLLGV